MSTFLFLNKSNDETTIVVYRWKSQGNCQTLGRIIALTRKRFIPTPNSPRVGSSEFVLKFGQFMECNSSEPFHFYL